MNNVRVFGIFEGEGEEKEVVGIVETTNVRLGTEDALKAYAKAVRYDQVSPIMAHSQGIHGDGYFERADGQRTLVSVATIPILVTM